MGGLNNLGKCHDTTRHFSLFVPGKCRRECRDIRATLRGFGAAAPRVACGSARGRARRGGREDKGVAEVGAQSCTRDESSAHLLQWIT